MTLHLVCKESSMNSGPFEALLGLPAHLATEFTRVGVTTCPSICRCETRCGPRRHKARLPLRLARCTTRWSCSCCCGWTRHKTFSHASCLECINDLLKVLHSSCVPMGSSTPKAID